MTAPYGALQRKQLGMFAKYWQPGAVKTRLAADIGAGPAADLYRLFLETLLRRFSDCADGRVLAFTPAERQAEFEALASHAWLAEVQCEGDLGARMAHHFARALSRAERAVLIGSDSPDLPLRFMDLAFELLACHDVVLGPTTDGGYYLIGLRQRVPAIFEGVDWGTSRVWTQTVSCLDRLGIGYAQLPQWHDVDTAVDLAHLHRQLSELPDMGADLSTLKQVTAGVLLRM